MSDSDEIGWIQNLSERRFFQFLLTYVVASWGFIQFIEWVVRRYGLNSGWVEAVIIFLAVCLPSVILFTYYHGKKGKDRWQKIEKIFIPLNILIAVALAYSFGPKTFVEKFDGPVTEVVSFVDEEGQAQERVVFNRSLNKRILMFPFSVVSDFTQSEWLRFVIPGVQEADIEQDNRMSVSSSSRLYDEIQKLGLEDFDELSFSLKRKLASDKYVDYFIDGTIEKSNNSFTIVYMVYKTDDGKKLLEKQYSNDDIFSIIDGFTIDLNEFLYNQIENAEDIPTYVDLPAAELKSANEEALIEFQKANQFVQKENDISKAITHLDKAIELDSKFFSAIHEKGQLLCTQNQVAEGLKFFEESINLMEGQPERLQLATKCQYYLFQNDMGKALRLGEMWKKLYPQNEEPYRILGLIYQITGQLDKLEVNWKEGYDAGHKGNFLLNLGNIYSEKGAFDEALKYFEEFQQLYPDKAGDIRQLGTLYLNQGDFNKAIEYFDNQILVDDNNVQNHLDLSTAYLKNGDFSSSEKSINNALNKSKSAQDSVTAMTYLTNYYYNRGMADKYLETDEKRISVFSTVAPPVVIDAQYYNYNSIKRYKDCGALELITQKHSGILENSDMGNVNFACIINVNLGIATKDGELMSRSLKECPEDLKIGGTESQMMMIDGYKDLYTGAYENALENMQQFMETTGLPKHALATVMAEINNNLGEYDESIDLLNEAYKLDKSNAEVQVLFAKAYIGKGNESKAKEALDRAFSIWSNADPDFAPMLDAKQLLKEI